MDTAQSTTSKDAGVHRHRAQLAANAETALRHATIRHARHDQMVVSKYNVRKRQPDNTVLKGLVITHGVLQNLICFEQLKNGKPTGLLEIVSGRQRHTVVGEAIAEGLLPEDYGIPYLLVTEDEAIDISLAENCGRVDMHPADLADAMLALAQHGRAIDDIALTYSLAPIEVRRRLKLAKVAPRLFELYRNDQATLQQMIALTITDSHKAQEHAWEALPANRRMPAELRRLLTSRAIDISTDRLGKYVGMPAYEHAGGVIRRDLFSDTGTGYIEDTALLYRLATNKLQRYRDKLMKSEKLHWVDMELDGGPALSQYRNVRHIPAPLSEQQTLWLNAMQERLALLDERLAAIDDDENDASYQDIVSERDELVAQLHAIHYTRSLIPHPEDLPLAGAVVYVGADGVVQVVRHLMRPGDADKMRGPTQEPAAAPVRPRATVPPEDRLTPDLISHRTAALQAELIDKADIALRYVTYVLVQQVLAAGAATAMAQIQLVRSPLVGTAASGPAAKAIAERRSALGALLPSDGKSLLTWMTEQDDATVLQILAYCVATAIDTKRTDAKSSPEFRVLAQALKLEMRKWWSPTAAHYFKHLTKAKMIEIVRTAISDEAAVPLEKLPKEVVACAAERALSNSRWLPTALRID
ncbi:ParB/RepB/Spo0J family partition protein [Pseudoduganella buxea]|uniref:Nuclease n=1 Tax=Pseudoduganella buxea TaxID=1949069 RepID=A0A6I3T0R0_9BURK|nr:hypothetical protein [Pseudoduganella buxea]MTV54929.1 hypothetical protein [Pseudoduganella buxea]GGC23712.1 nuclease [Pseudoduganella buxea]